MPLCWSRTSHSRRTGYCCSSSDSLQMDSCHIARWYSCPREQPNAEDFIRNLTSKKVDNNDAGSCKISNKILYVRRSCNMRKLSDSGVEQIDCFWASAVGCAPSDFDTDEVGIVEQAATDSSEYVLLFRRK